MLVKEIQSIDEFFKEIASLYNNLSCNELWFRGEPKDYQERALTPSLLRDIFWNLLNKESSNGKLTQNFLYKFYTFYQQINATAWRFGDSKNIGDLYSLALLRHYGVKTALLDFSSSPLIALYFALAENGITHNDDGVIYVLNPCLLNFQKTFGKYLGLVANDEDFNTKIRLVLPYIVFKKEATLTVGEIPPFLDFFKFEKVKETFRDFDLAIKTKRQSYNIKYFLNIQKLDKDTNCLEEFHNKLKETFKVDEDKIDVRLYTTPIAVSFKYSLPYMSSQEAVGILFGFTWLYNETEKYYEFIGFKNLLAFIETYFPKCLQKKILFKIRLKGTKKKEMLYELIHKFGVNKFDIFGKDLRFVESKAFKQLIFLENNNDILGNI